MIRPLVTGGPVAYPGPAFGQRCAHGGAKMAATLKQHVDKYGEEAILKLVENGLAGMVKKEARKKERTADREEFKKWMAAKKAAKA